LTKLGIEPASTTSVANWITSYCFSDRCSIFTRRTTWSSKLCTWRV